MGAIFYDTLLLLAVLFFATALALPFNSGRAFTADQFYFPLYLFAVSYAFYTGFWTHGGQTLGLRAWKLKVCSLNGGPVSWKQASVRFLVAILSWACLGLGFLWCLVAKNRLCWHDHFSHTQLKFIPGEKRGRQK